MNELIYEVWVKTDENNIVIALDGGVTLSNVDTETWTKIDEGTDYLKYGGCQQHYVEMPLYTDDFIPRYKLVENEVVLREESEIIADREIQIAKEEAHRLAIEEEAKRPFVELQEQIDTLKTELSELRSFVNSIGKTELQGDGSADQPFEWAEGIELIPNAYYSYNGKRFVWMGTAGVATSDNMPEDDGEGNWVEF